MSSTVLTSPRSFSAFSLDRNLLRGIVDAGFENPRPIQSLTIPAALEGRDILGLAHTGTGKTAAFALPILHHLRTSPPGDPGALIVAPTRELAAQISEEIRRLARHTNLRVATVFGGVSAHAQANELARHPEIIVACPGRLLDLHQQGLIRLNRVRTLVLDEADHMFDMGFLPDLRRILGLLPERRQNLLFSATMPDEIRKLADGLLQNPLVVELSHSQPVPSVSHSAFTTDSRQKFSLLQQVLAEDGFTSAIVFTRTKHRAKRLAQDLERSGCRAVALQGNMSQIQRVRAMEGFRTRRFDVLVATDIAARGIDVEKVSHVVNFDMPDTADAYTHRIGRTGRAERSGKAVSFVTHEDHDVMRAIEGRIGSPVERWAMEQISGRVTVSRVPLADQPRVPQPLSRVRSFGPRGSRQSRPLRRGF